MPRVVTRIVNARDRHVIRALARGTVNPGNRKGQGITSGRRESSVIWQRMRGLGLTDSVVCTFY